MEELSNSQARELVLRHERELAALRQQISALKGEDTKNRNADDALRTFCDALESRVAVLEDNEPSPVLPRPLEAVEGEGLVDGQHEPKSPGWCWVWRVNYKSNNWHKEIQKCDEHTKTNETVNKEEA